MARVVVDELRSAYAGKRVLVTGHTGFKGSWLTLCLRHFGAEVAGIALEPDEPDSLFVQARVADGINHNTADIRDGDAVSSLLKSFKPETVFHLAAQALVRRSFSESKLTFDTNVGGSVNVLEAVRHSPSVRSLVYVTSDKCYLNREWTFRYRENDRLGGHDPYSASKAAAEIVYASYVASFFAERATLGTASMRAGNVVGGGDWAVDRIVPDCVRALARSQPILLRNPDSTRPWQHVLEPVVAYLIMGARLLDDPLRFTGAWNIGPRIESTRTVGELADAFVAEWGSGKIERAPHSVQPHEAKLLHLNCDKAHSELKWRPRWDFERTIKETVAWYSGVVRGGDPAKLSADQLRRYLEEWQ